MAKVRRPRAATLSPVSTLTAVARGTTLSWLSLGRDGDALAIGEAAASESRCGDRDSGAVEDAEGAAGAGGPDVSRAVDGEGVGGG